MTNANLNEIIAKVTESITQAYELGRQSVRPRTNLISQAKLTPLTAQDIRDSIVEQAKRDVAELELRHETENDADVVTFVVNAEKRTVVALIDDVYSDKVHSRGIAKCAPSDCFNVHIGRAIALRRALRLGVPTEYLTAPQPTEVRVGDVVRYDGEGCGRIAKVIADSADQDNYRETYLSTAKFSHATIIDDSREGAE